MKNWLPILASLALLITTAQAQFQKPVGVSQALSRCTNNVSFCR